MNRKPNNMKKVVVEVPEMKLWDSGFSVFKRRIGELLQLNGFDDDVLDDDSLMPFYRQGESETFVLSALGCAGTF